MKNFKSIFSILLGIAVCLPSIAKKKNKIIEERIQCEIFPDNRLFAEIEKTQEELILKKDIHSKGIIIPYYDMALGIIIEKTTDVIKKAIKKRNDAYKATWKTEATGYFYNAPSYADVFDPTGMQFGGIRIQRTVIEEQHPDKTNTAFYLVCRLNKQNLEDMLVNSRFELILDTLQIDLSRTKAKLPPNKLYNIEVNITVLASWFGIPGLYCKDQELGKFTFSIQNKKYDPAYPICTFTQEKGQLIPGSAKLIPRSTTGIANKGQNYTNIWGRGDFRILVEVKEDTKRKTNNWIEKISIGIIETTGKELKSENVFKN